MGRIRISEWIRKEDMKWKRKDVGGGIGSGEEMKEKCERLREVIK